MRRDRKEKEKMRIQNIGTERNKNFKKIVLKKDKQKEI